MIRTTTAAIVGLAAFNTAHSMSLIQKRDTSGGSVGSHGGHSHGGAQSSNIASGYSQSSSPGYTQQGSFGGTGYGATSGYGYETQSSLPDLTPLIIGLLVLTGLSLLFPTYVSLSTVRRKRDLDSDAAAGKRTSRMPVASNRGFVPSPHPLLTLSVKVFRDIRTHFAFFHSACLQTHSKNQSTICFPS